MENERFVTVLTFTYAHEVAIIRSRLESEGITCFVKDELTTQVHPFYSNAIGGVKLQVLESDLEQTVGILKEAGYIKDEGSQPGDESKVVEPKETDDQENAAKTSGVVCPFCGSEEVAKARRGGWLFLLTSLLMMFPTPFSHRKYYCFNCKQEFKLKRR